MSRTGVPPSQASFPVSRDAGGGSRPTVCCAKVRARFFKEVFTADRGAAPPFGAAECSAVDSGAVSCVVMKCLASRFPISRHGAGPPHEQVIRPARRGGFLNLALRSQTQPGLFDQ